MRDKVVVLADIEGIRGYVYPCELSDADEDLGLPDSPNDIGFTRAKARAKVFNTMEEVRQALRPWEILLGPDKHGEDGLYWEAYGEGTASFIEIAGDGTQ